MKTDSFFWFPVVRVCCMFPFPLFFLFALVYFNSVDGVWSLLKMHLSPLHSKKVVIPFQVLFVLFLISLAIFLVFQHGPLFPSFRSARQ